MTPCTIPFRHRSGWDLGSEDRRSRAMARRDAARACMGLGDGPVPPALQRELARLLGDPSIRLLPALAEERQIVERLAVLPDSTPRSAARLLAGMLFFHACELGWMPDPDGVAEGLLPLYWPYVHEVPPFFHGDEDRQAYVDRLARWTRRLSGKLASADASPFWQAAGRQFADLASFVPTYFTDGSLKPLFQDRAAVLSAVMRHAGLPLDHAFPPRRPGPLRLGVLNGVWMPTTETYATLPVFEHLDPERFEVTVYCLRESGTAIEAFCRSAAKRWVVLPDDIVQAPQRIRADDLDILFFGTNLTAVTSTAAALALHRLARIQMTSFCCPCTTGMHSMDCFVAGTLTEPSADAQDQYTERLLRLDGSGICFDYSRKPTASGQPLTRASLGIPDDALVFASGANMYKVGRPLRKAWARILAQTPGSVLVAYPFGPAWSKHYPAQAFTAAINEELAACGVSPERFRILKPMPTSSDIGAVLRCADVYLDSFPYSGATSLLDPLEAGIPIVTVHGGILRFSQASALLREAGLAELVSSDADHYCRSAIDLAGDSGKRRQLAARVVETMAKVPAFLDTATYGRAMATVFEGLVAGR